MQSPAAPVDAVPALKDLSSLAPNANAVEPLTPTASAVVAHPTTLPASQFVLPVASASDPLFHPDLLAPWPLLRVFQKNNMNASQAVRDIAKGERIAKFYGEVQTTPTLYTLQIADKVHVACSLGGPTYVNHSCDPAAFFDHSDCTESAPFPILTALRPIAAGEEITFNYCHNEWLMDAPFFCLCGSKQCLGKIEGFSKLSLETQRATLPFVSKFIANKWREQQEREAAQQQNQAAHSSA